MQLLDYVFVKLTGLLGYTVIRCYCVCFKTVSNKAKLYLL